MSLLFACRIITYQNRNRRIHTHFLFHHFIELISKEKQMFCNDLDGEQLIEQ